MVNRTFQMKTMEYDMNDNELHLRFGWKKIARHSKIETLPSSKIQTIDDEWDSSVNLLTF